MQKKVWSALFLALFILLIFSSPAWAEPIIQRSIKFGGDNHLPPYEYVNDNGIYKGFNVDIMHAIAIQAGLDIELHPMPWYELSRAIETGEIDAIQGLAMTEESTGTYDFSESYLTISRGIFVRCDNNYIVDYDDLRNVRVAVQKNNVPARLLQYKTPDSLIYVDNQQQGILLLMMGNADAFVGNRMVGLYTIQKWRQTNFIKIVGGEIESATYGIAVKKGNKELLNVLNKGLKEIKANGTYQKIYTKWFGELIQTPGEIWQNIIEKLIWVLLAISLIFIAIIRVNQLLKREVKKRTLELAEANEMLQERNERIEREHRFKIKILNSVFHSVITVDKDGTINYVNGEAYTLLNQSPGEIIGQKSTDTPLLRFINIKLLLEVLKNGGEYLNQEKIITRKGERKVFSYSIYSLRSSQNEINGAIISIREITREKDLQENLIRKDKMQALGQLVATIAHEIRNPLMAVKTFINLLPSRIAEEDFRKELLEFVPAELERLNRLVTDLLEYARPRKAKKELFLVEGLLAEIISLFKNKLNEKEIKMYLEIDENTLVYADRQQLKQILINLIINAIQASKDKGSIKVKVGEIGNNTVLEIRDNGIGIPANLLGKVMDPFFTSKNDGAGLGLSICYRLVKEHEGDILIDSIPHQGTTVIITLPKLKGGEKSNG